MPVDVKISPRFKNQTLKAITAILFFVFVYFLIFLFAIALTLGSIAAGLLLIYALPKMITILFGIGIASIGVFVLFFLLKFLFKSNKIDRSHLVEIQRTDEPELFSMIDDIVRDVDTGFPKRVYLSADVNAAVFYNSSFWSMILPVRKNLQIGIGLVNMVTKSELKAVLAHEFGHFSQRSMKVGSYVYNVNKVLYNLLFDNESYEQFAAKWGNVHGVFSLFVLFSFKIIQLIQWMLKLVFSVVNISYMGLSREMEFHADEIAANITGYYPLKSSLLRFSFADYTYNTVVNFYQERLSKNIRSANFYQEHYYVTQFVARENQIRMENNLPVITEEDLNKFNKSKLVIKDQWASHPSTEERITRLEHLGLIKEISDDLPANSIFVNIEKTQKQLTDKIFSSFTYKSNPSTLTFDEFKLAYEKEFIENSFSKRFNSYYDNRNPFAFDLTEVRQFDYPATSADLFSDDVIDRLYSLISLNNDLEVLKEIANKNIRIKSFDYDGIKYKQNQAADLAKKLLTEQELLNVFLNENDKRIYAYFLNKEMNEGSIPKLNILYQDLFNYEKEFNDRYKPYLDMINKVQPLFYAQTNDDVTIALGRLGSQETSFKEHIRELLDNPTYQTSISDEIRENFDLYVSKKWYYFGYEGFIQYEIDILLSALNNYTNVLNRRYFLIKKELLDYQAGLF
jgi:Zn-dependent protease with chaperone function